VPTLPGGADVENSDPDSAGGKRPAGRIVHDARGNAVWNWGGSADTPHISLDSTSTMLKRLELPELKVEGQEETAKDPANAVAVTSAKKPAPDVSGGYNPYDQRKAVRKPTEPKGPVGKKSR
jgi:hypothetical protein